MLNNKKILFVVAMLFCAGSIQPNSDMSGFKTLARVIAGAYAADTLLKVGEQKWKGQAVMDAVKTPARPVRRVAKDDDNNEREVVGVNFFGLECDLSWRKGVGLAQTVESLRVSGEMDGRKALEMVAVYFAGKKAGLL